MAVVQEELLLGEPLDSIFAEFDPVPLGSASIAQARRQPRPAPHAPKRAHAQLAPALTRSQSPEPGARRLS